jgi:hypothetical protein
MKRLLMALIDGVHFYKTRKDESKKIMAKFTRHSNEAFLEDAYQSSNKLFEQVPLVNREGMDVQVKDALSRKPGSALKVDDIVDDSLVLELEKEDSSVESTSSQSADWVVSSWHDRATGQ